MSERESPGGPRLYANWLKVGFNQEEFILDFGQKFNESTVIVHTGIVTTPNSARDFLDTLQDSLDRHKQTAGRAEEEKPRP